MRPNKRVVGVTATIAGLLTLLLIVGVPAASAASVQFVGSSVGANTSCNSPGYTSVQAAVDAAAPGDTVYLCGTTPFAEQVIINKSLTLTGQSGATIAAPSSSSSFASSSPPLPPQFATDNLFQPQAIVMVWGAGVNVAISGLIIAGVLPGNDSCAEQEFGIVVIAGATANITGDTVQDIKDSNPALYGCQFGIGIQVGRRYWPKSDFSSFVQEDFVGSATISGTTVTGYQKGGIAIDGPGSSASVGANTVTGAGPTSALGLIIAQNGIVVSRGAKGTVTGNTVTDNAYAGSAGASSAGILVVGGPWLMPAAPFTVGVIVKNNTVTDNDVGVWLFNANANLTAPSTATNDTVKLNTISNGQVTNTSGDTATCGYQAGIADLGKKDLIVNNSISGDGYTKQANGDCSGIPPAFLRFLDITTKARGVPSNKT